MSIFEEEEIKGRIFCGRENSSENVEAPQKKTDPVEPAAGADAESCPFCGGSGKADYLVQSGFKTTLEECPCHMCVLTQDALSEKVGKKRSSVSNYLRLLKLPDEVQLALKEGLISMGHAKAIAGAPADQQLRALKKCIKKGLSVRQAEELSRSLAEAPAAAAQPAEDEEYPDSYLRLVEQLEKFFSQEISIKRAKNGGGKIVIGFDDDKDIERFIERFAKRS